MTINRPEYRLPLIDGNRVATKTSHDEEINRVTGVLVENDLYLDRRIDSVAVAGPIVGSWDAASGAFPTMRPDGSPILAGDAWEVIGAGTVDGQDFVVGDYLQSIKNGGGATFDDNWARSPLGEMRALADQVEMAASFVPRYVITAVGVVEYEFAENGDKLHLTGSNHQISGPAPWSFLVLGQDYEITTSGGFRAIGALREALLAGAGGSLIQIASIQRSAADNATLEDIAIAVQAAGPVYPSRAAWLASETPASVLKESWISGGQAYGVVRDFGGPLVKDDGSQWRPDGDVYVEHFGALNNGIIDCGPPIEAAAAYSRSKGIRVSAKGGSGVYRVTTSSPINLRNVPVDFSTAVIRFDHSEIGLILGARSNVGEGPTQHIYDVRRTGGMGLNPTIRVVGAKNAHYIIDRSDYVQLYADTATDAQTPFASGSIAYCTFDISHVELLELSTNPDTDGTLDQWINENRFNLNRIYGFRCSGTYQHNHNSFYGGAIEQGLKEIRFDVGNSNVWRALRLEGSGHTIFFGANTRSNILERSWTASTVAPPDEFLPPGSVLTDLGVDNKCATALAVSMQWDTVAYASIADVVLNNAAGELSARSTRLQSIHSQAGNAAVCISPFIPVRPAERFYWGLNGPSTSLYRPFIRYYDENLVPISVDNSYFVFGGFTGVVTGNELRPSTGRLNASGYHNPNIPNTARFCRAGWLVSSSQQEFALAKELWVRHSNTTVSAQNLIGRPAYISNMLYSAAPTQGFAPVGFVVNRTNGSRHVCTFALDTSLTAAASTSETSISVSSTTGVSVGDIVGVNLDDGATHWTSVSAVSGGTITLSAGLPSDAAVNSRVVFNRWINGS